MSVGRIAIIGTGAVGGYYGGRLAQHGADVHFLLRSDYDAVKAGGLKVRSVAGDFALAPEAIHAYRDAREMPKVDLVILTLKTTASDRYAELIAPLLHDTTAILTMQNGLGIEQSLADLFGAERILGGVCFVCINRIAPGELDHTAHGLVRLGEFTRRSPDRAREIAELFSRSQVTCEVVDDLARLRWEKLLWNVPFNGVSTLMDLTTDRILATENGIALIRAIMRDVQTAARCAGVTLDDALIEANISRTFAMGAYRTSTHVDRLEGRTLELETMFMAPLRIAQEAGADTPYLRVLSEFLNVLRG